MFNLGHKKFEDVDGNIYELDLTANPREIINSKLEVVIAVTYTNKELGVTFNTEFVLQFDAEEEVLTLLHNDKICGRIPLRTIDEGVVDRLADSDNTEESFSVLRDLIEDGSFELEINEAVDNALRNETSVFRDVLIELIQNDSDIPVEQLIDLIPTGDPIFGCLLRSGISTAAGQGLRCYLEQRKKDHTSKRRMIWEILRCMGHNSLRMLAKFTRKTFLCALSAGLPIISIS
jgi:hypothetical protein